MTPHRVFTDLTSLLPGGENGGLGSLSLELLSELTVETPATQFLLLLASGSPLIEREFPPGSYITQIVPEPPSHRRSLADSIADLLLRRGPSKIWKKRVERRWQREMMDAKPPLDFDPLTDVLFSPLLGTSLYGISGATVAVIPDFQHRVLPEFFDDATLWVREWESAVICARATRVVCISEFVRRTVAGAFPDSVGKLEVIYPTLDRRRR